MKYRWMNSLAMMCAIMVVAGTAGTSPVWGAAHGGVIALDRTAPQRVVLGDVFEYQIRITNLTDAELTDLVVTEAPSSAFKFDSAVPAPASVAAGEMRWDLGTLAPKASRVITVKGSATQQGSLKNCNSLRVSYGLDACAVTEVVQPALKLTKTGPAEVLRCDPIPVQMVVTNTGSGAAENVVVEDKLPEGLTTQGGGKVVRAEIGRLEPGQSRQVSVVLQASRTGAFENRAVASADRNLRAEATHRVTVREPRLELAKSGPAQRYLGRNAAYKITVSNRGDGAAKDTRVVDALPAGMSFLSASDGGTLTGSNVVWDLGTLAPNAMRELSLKVKANRIGVMKNMATANAYCAEAAAEFVTKVVGIPAILLEVVDLEDPIELGENLTYVITVTNQGSADGTNIRLVCTLPVEQDYVRSSGPTTASVASKTITFASLPSLAPKAKATYKVIVKGLAAGDVRFRVELNSDQMTSNVMETEATRIYE